MLLCLHDCVVWVGWAHCEHVRLSDAHLAHHCLCVVLCHVLYTYAELQNGDDDIKK